MQQALKAVSVCLVLQDDTCNAGVEGPPVPRSGPGLAGAGRHSDAQRKSHRGATRLNGT